MQEPYPDQVNHIERGKETDLFIVVPATANTIAKLAHGFADNMVTSTALALPDHVKKQFKSEAILLWTSLLNSSKLLKKN